MRQRVSDTGQEPTTDQSQEPAAGVDGAETFSAEYVRGLRSEAAEYRTRSRELEQRLARLDADRTKAEHATAEKQGEFERLYRETESKLTSFSSAAKGRFLSMELQSAAIKAGVDPTMAARLAYPTEGLTVTDDLTIEGDVATALKDFLEPFIIAKEPEPTQRPRPVAIGEHPQKQTPPQSSGVRGYAEAVRRKLNGLG